MINACWLWYLLCYVNKAVAFSFQFQGGVAAFIWKQAGGGQGEPCQPVDGCVLSLQPLSGPLLGSAHPKLISRGWEPSLPIAASPFSLLPPTSFLFPLPSSLHPLGFRLCWGVQRSKDHPPKCSVMEEGRGWGQRAASCRPQTVSKLGYTFRCSTNPRGKEVANVERSRCVWGSLGPCSLILPAFGMENGHCSAM